MAKASPNQNIFTGGEVSPLYYGRSDSPQYKAGLAKCFNYLPMLQGALQRRPGSYFVSEVKTSSKVTRLIPFVGSNKQPYMLEFGDLYIRFYKNDAAILSGGVPYEIDSPYPSSALSAVNYAQSGDTLYLVHPSYPPLVLTRTSDTSWDHLNLNFFDGPYLDSIKDNTISSSPGGQNTLGDTVTFSAASTNSVNGGLGFQSTDTGRMLRVKSSSSNLWSNYVITAVTDTKHITTSLIYGPSPTLSTEWRLGVYSQTTGYPAAITFHQSRLVLGGAKVASQRIDSSAVNDFSNFQPTDTAGAVTDQKAYSYGLASSQINIISWLKSGYRGLYAGSNGSEWLLAVPQGSGAITATNTPQVSEVTHYGSSTVQPVQVGDAILFIQRSGRKIRELTFVYDPAGGGYQALDLNEVAEHITRTGIVDACFQNEPQPILWCVLKNGRLAAMTYERELNALKVAWSPHQIAGRGVGSDPAMVESIASIPYFDGSRDEVWMIVKRVINGSTKRYIEVLTQFFDDGLDQRDAFFLDAGLSLDSPAVVTGATQANPVVVTAAAHGFSNGDTIRFDEVSGMVQLNGKKFLISSVTTNTFTLAGINGTAFGAFAAGSSGEARKLVSAVTGLSHLEGETVQILADGAVHPAQVVVSGTVSLEVPAAVVHVGLGFNSDAQQLRLEAGSQDGTSIGKTRRTHRVGFMMHSSLGLKVGTNFDELETVSFRDTEDPIGVAPPLFSGIVSVELPADYDMENQVCWRQDQPLPSTINAVMPQMVTQDRS